MSDQPAAPDPKRLLEALLFAATQPLDERELQLRLGDAALPLLLAELEADYRGRGIRLERHGTRWAFRTAPDLGPFLRHADERIRPLGKAALETLAVIAYQQPVTRAEIEAVRGVAVTRGTIDLLVEAGWVKPAGRRETPGRPVTWVTTPAFLDHLDLGSLDDLPRLQELMGADLFAARDRAEGEEVAE